MESNGKKQKDYSKAKIYVLRNSVDDEVYVGSTCQPLSKRFHTHKLNTGYTKTANYKIYIKMREIGIDKFYIELFENCPCENWEQLRRKEGEVIRQLGASLNSRVECRTKSEWYNDKKEDILRKQKENRDNNIVEFREKEKNYINNNKDKKREADRKYREKHNEEIKEIRRIKVSCECGAVVSKLNLPRHKRSNTHQKYIDTLEQEH